MDTNEPRTSKIPYWRAGTLSLVYVLMAIHFLHWRISGKTLAPLELNEVMYTLELGIVTVGFLFMLTAVLVTAVFGRFFCSWGCHILALQDLCAWILRKLRIRPRAIRSRLLLWAPFIAATYMFVWPQVSRRIEGKPVQSLHVATDAEGWASFTTENFWRNLPTPGVIAATFGICGFVIVYSLGTRSFCSYGCPYGAIFGLVDRVAPGRIRVGSDCEQCATCTAVCTSNVRVHEEVNRYGMVVNPACLKDLDCVTACPQQTLHYGFGRPSLMKRVIGDTKVKRFFDWSLWEEAVAGVVFVLVLVTFRGLYNIIPFLLSLAIAAILAYAALVSLRLLRQKDVLFNRWSLRAAGVVTGLGLVFSCSMLLVTAFVVHSGFVRYHEFQGRRYARSAFDSAAVQSDAGNRAIEHLSKARSLGLLPLPETEIILCGLFEKSKRWSDAEAIRRQIAERVPNDARAREKLAIVLGELGRYGEAKNEYLESIQRNAERAEPHYGLAGAYFQLQLPDLAEQELRLALQIRPDLAAAHYDLGALLIKRRLFEEGIHHFRACLHIDDRYGDAHYNLGVALAMTGDLQTAMTEIELAEALQPNDEQTKRFKAYLMNIITGAPTPRTGE